MANTMIYEEVYNNNEQLSMAQLRIDDDEPSVQTELVAICESENAEDAENAQLRERENTMMALAESHHTNGCLAEAFEVYSRLVFVQKRVHGPESMKVAHTLSCMGLLQYEQRHFASALSLFEQALDIQLDRAPSSGSIELASTLNSLGHVLFFQKQYTLAQACFTDSMRMKASILGPDHHEIAILKCNLASIALEMGNDDAAVRLYKEALRVDRVALGSDHDCVIQLLVNIGIIYQARYELSDALEHLCLALDIVQLKRGNENTALVAKLLNLIGNIYLQNADVANMMKCYAEAARLYRECHDDGEVLVIAGYNFYCQTRLHPPSAPLA